MSKKYISQINSNNFVYPNNKLAEYDVEIIHDLKENSVSGVTSGFDIALSGSTIVLSFTYTWYLNNAEPFISNDNKLNVLSLHMQTPDKPYFKPWVCVGLIQRSNTSLTTVTDTQRFEITPQMAGVDNFINGTYFFEIRFLGKRAIFPINVSDNLVTPTPPPPTPCYCYEIHVTGSTGSIEYIDCNNNLITKSYVGVQVDNLCILFFDGMPQVSSTTGIDTSYISGGGVGNCRTGTCPPGVTPTPTPTPTITPTASGGSIVGPYNYYFLTRYTCPNCTDPLNGLIGRTSASTFLTLNYYYNVGDGYVYKNNGGTIGPSFDVDLDLAASAGTNCSGTCAI